MGYVSPFALVLVLTFDLHNNTGQASGPIESQLKIQTFFFYFPLQQIRPSTLQHVLCRLSINSFPYCFISVFPSQPYKQSNVILLALVLIHIRHPKLSCIGERRWQHSFLKLS